MNITLDRQAGLGLKVQLKAQLKAAIRSGELPAGQALPAGRDLAKVLNINRNTIWSAYRELAAEGWLRSKAGAGTFVNPGLEQQEAADIRAGLRRAALAALEGGAEAGHLTESLQALAAELAGPLTGMRVLVVECNQEGLDLIAGQLAEELGLETVKAFIQDLETDPALAARLAQEADLVVAGLNHAAEFRAVVPDSPTPLTAVLLRPEWAVMNRLAELEPGSRVGFVCINDRSTEALFKDYLFERGTSLRKVWAGLNNTQGLAQVLNGARLIYASSFAFAQVKALADPGQELIQVDLGVDRAGIEAVRARLLRLKLQKALTAQENLVK